MRDILLFAGLVGSALTQAGVIADDARVISLYASKSWALPGAAPATHIDVHQVSA